MKDFATAHAMHKRMKKMAKGGEIKRKDSDEMAPYARREIENPDEKGVHQIGYGNARHSPGESNVGNSLRSDPGFSKKSHIGLMQQNGRREEHKRVLREGRSMKKGYPDHFAEGGFVEDEMGEYDPMEHPEPEMNEAAEGEDMDMIHKLLAKHFSKGGMVANDVGVAEADKLPAEYDDLVLRDDDMSDADYTGANSGDEMGNKQMDSDEHDIIARIMKSRAKKDRMPRPA
jgi:hypothetical protein